MRSKGKPIMTTLMITEKGSLHMIQYKYPTRGTFKNFPGRTKVSGLFSNVEEFKM
jgi:hypothetical protein